ncbi:hypothetical protein K443DRAFT_657906 [Laccaria amethystina LaAM-08-1]|uniref:Uncharacterized protein n=1 Tax=Laccaria amethystina LaAM-08-1 TaxID=1095629 RepID=A0A0C9WH82_9AGAR|nr:hypothetical protein K443DRAFT_657906 [Laccaria amethystina LaAM-08-1]
MPSQPSQDTGLNSNNDQNHPPTLPTSHPDYQCPSEAWLKNPAWIDGGVNPPRFYYSHEEINEALVAAGVTPRTEYNQQLAQVTPTPAQSNRPAPLTPSLANGSNNYYRTAIGETLPTSVGHLVNVSLVHPIAAAPSTARGKAAPKKGRTTKMDTIKLDAVSRIDFVKAILKIHGLAETFSPGVHSGPNFKIWWSGASGGKGGAPLIQNDHQFGVALAALLKKDKSKLPLGISDAAAARTDEELVYGTRIPHVEGFSDATQLHGRFILELKKKWPCQQHHGEHGEPGFCYVNPTWVTRNKAAGIVWGLGDTKQSCWDHLGVG